MTVTGLLDQLIVEGIDQMDHPGITFRGPAHDRRAAHVAAAARREGRAVVTENVVDFGSERDVVLVFVLKNLPTGGGQAAALAKVLDRWAEDHPDPYLGPHWPST
jgi:hypothetical protein